MFPKAARFKEPKPSDIPGPGAYNPADLDAVFSHKRGAILEAERFGEEKVSDIPGEFNARRAHLSSRFTYNICPRLGPNAYAPHQPQPGPSKPPALSSAVLKQQVLIAHNPVPWHCI